MIWQIVCRVGEEDFYEPTHITAHARVYVGIDRPNDESAVKSNVKTVLQGANVRPPASALDLLHLAMTVYSADRRVPRKAAYNRWERGFRVFLPVSDPLLWSSAKPAVEKMLNFLTSDHWEIECRQAAESVAIEAEQNKLPGLSNQTHAVALLSGGLDSFAGAVGLLQGSSAPVAFVSHYGRGNVTHKVQERVYSLLAECYPKRFKIFHFFVQPSMSMTGESEPSSRSRSVLFLSLGIAIASALEKDTPLYIAENGFMSLNVPLSHNRIGSLSTRTTHPYFLEMFREVLRKLKIEVSVENPCRFFTKGELLENLKTLEVVRRGTPLTMSCSNSLRHRFRKVSTYTHCGYCLPCLVRRAAIHKAGLGDATYNMDVIQNPQGEDLHALKMAIRRIEASESPLVFDVLKAGPLPDSQEEYVDVYRRGLLELKQFLYQSSRDE